MIASEISSTGLPPYFSGIVIPCYPYSQNFCHSSKGGVAVLSLSRQVGANTSSAKLRTISRIILCSSVSMNSTISPNLPKRMVLLMSRNGQCNIFYESNDSKQLSVGRRSRITMADSDYVEFSVAQGRKYTLEHLWLQVLDEKKSDSQVKIGLSEFVRAEFGDIIRVILTKPEDDSEFKIEDSDDDEGEVSQDDDAASPMTSGDELGLDDLLITVTTEYEKLLINAPFPCKIVSLNGDVEDNPDLVNDDAYADGWCVIVQPFDYDGDQYLDENEYIEYLNEL